MTGETSPARGKVLATKKIECGDWFYQGNVVVGNTDSDRVVVYSAWGRSLSSNDKLPYHVPLRQIPTDILDQLNAGLGTEKARLPHRTMEAKEYLRAIHHS